jgi:hypothetical protein
MATGLEVVGAVSASLHLVELATKAVKLFSDMSTGFKDADGKAALIHQELFNFKQSAKFANHNLSHVQVDDLGLKQSLSKYEDSISQLGYKMQTIQAKKKLIGRTKMWMKLMSSDSEVNMLRQQLEKHTGELMGKFTVVMLKEIKGDVKEIKTDVRAHYDFSRSTHQYNVSAYQSIMLRHEASEEKLDTLAAKFEAAIGLQTPVMSPFRTDDNDLFDLHTPPLSPSPPLSASPPFSASPPLSPAISPAADVTPEGSSPRTSGAWCGQNMVRRDSTDTYAYCEGSDCDAYSFTSRGTEASMHRLRTITRAGSLASWNS